ncbi:MAG: 1-acyl-sn-glycerol-3-phosphate acyltransferase [Saprospiraceae bacterium]|jgi:glycerol-3-phosphate O-acyltransferase|nr:1-acyl-sn-glycerol-3-phosphate acyltransferase [Saprospiraceae bacterium]MDP4821991.1 1-acyl-sn-glycerol-3-phosphate acyltransferase [Saprospiraceae bacterium]MDP4999058.1 1-acyl-sn-glycerol-3-phosphate acyltransferase [Saprospiraceae bacterium]
MSPKSSLLPHVMPNISEWPIYLLSEDRKRFVREIQDQTLAYFLELPLEKQTDVINKTIYLERIRVKEEPWKVDPAKEEQFFKRLQQKLIKSSIGQTADQTRVINREIFESLIQRYAEEIVGTFKIGTFRFARKFLTLFFTRLLNTAAAKNLFDIWGNKMRLSDRMIVDGPLDKIRELMSKGTLVFLPTHFSNLDSILVGFAIDTFVGIPAPIYGAGLNLYNSGIAAYFMNRLGAYRVDRRKKNAIYLETLKNMSSLALQRGTNSVFFPGGTRSRSGSLETKLKLGLLSTLVEAQRSNMESGKGEKIFVVPMILSYHFVLEARFLIEQHLRRMGREKYLREKDRSNQLYQILTYSWHSFSQKNDVMISFGEPMDVMGNVVNAAGESFDQYGKQIDIAEYFMRDGKLVTDPQRDGEYTRILADKVVESYFRYNIVLSSHLTAYAAFEWLKMQDPKLDLYGILRLPPEDIVFSKSGLMQIISSVRASLLAQEAAGKVKLSPILRQDPEVILKDGIRHLGSYHYFKPLKFNKQGKVVSQNLKTLFFYHNRLDYYNLEGVIPPVEGNKSIPLFEE